MFSRARRQQSPSGAISAHYRSDVACVSSKDDARFSLLCEAGSQTGGTGPASGRKSGIPEAQQASSWVPPIKRPSATSSCEVCPGRNHRITSHNVGATRRVEGRSLRSLAIQMKFFTRRRGLR